jgi:hypothetical protein
VTASRRVLAVGGAVAVVAVYLAGAAISGRLSPAARRPLLDGFGSVQPYRWVHPPPALAANNQAPHNARQTFAFKGGTFQGGVVSTNDLQSTVILQDGSIAPSNGQTGALVSIDPLDPADFGEPPDGLSFDGNVYRITGTYQPGRSPLPSIDPAADLALTYPADAAFGLDSLTHVILTSPDGRTWRSLASQDLPSNTQPQVTSKMTDFGYFAVGRSGGTAAAKGWPLSRLVPILVAGVVVLLILLFTSPRVIRRLRGRGADDEKRGDAETGP